MAPTTPLAPASVTALEEKQRHRLSLDDGFGVIADDLDAVAEGLGFSLPDLDDSDSNGDGDSDGDKEEGASV